jgi:hypothetical protein
LEFTLVCLTRFGAEEVVHLVYDDLERDVLRILLRARAGAADALQLPVAHERDVDRDRLVVLDPDQYHVGEVNVGRPGRLGDDLVE